MRPGQGFGACRAPSAEELIAKVPVPALCGLGAGGTGFRPQGRQRRSWSPVKIVINADNQLLQEMAGQIQQHIIEAWAYRNHDLEPELT